MLTEREVAYIQEHIPPPHNTPDSYEEFIEQKLEVHKALCTTLMKTVDSLLIPLREQYRHRFFCRLDGSNHVKKPSSIIDKILRSQKANQAPRDASSDNLTIDNFASTMTDLVRFRIVCNFLSDVRKVAEAISASEEVNGNFLLEIKDSLEQRPTKRKSGERSIKFILEYKLRPGLFIEIQIMTQLQEAWDKKDHFLVYEKRRTEPNNDEENFPDYLDAKLFAMSELLYVADNYFDDLRNSRENEDPIQGGSHAAT